MSNRVKALFFDVFGTVVDWRNSIAEEIGQVAKNNGVSIDCHEFADKWRSLYQPAMAPIRDGSRGYTRLDILHRENLDEILSGFGLGDLDESERDSLNRAWHRLAGWPDASKGLHRLKSRFIIAPMSNGNVSLMVDMAKHSDLPWDTVLGAEPARQYKPHPQTYLTGADWLDLDPGECMMVAAHNGDLVAAAELGLKTAFILRPTEHGPGQTTDLKAEAEFDYVCADFLELADKLGCP